MATKQLILPGVQVKKSNEFVRSKLKVNDALAGRIFACFVSLIKSDDKDFLEHRIPAGSVLGNTGGKDYKELRDSCQMLASASIERKLDSKDSFIFSPLFASIGYEKGIVFAKINPELKSMLLELQTRFTKYNLLEYMVLPSVYSQRMFEILKSYSSLEEVVLNLDDLHRMLDTPETLRANFKNFRLRVLEKASRDINSKTFLDFEWEPIKQGRAVVSVKFFFREKRKGPWRPPEASGSPPDHKEAQACWLENYRNRTPCEIRQRGDAGGVAKCQTCLEKLPLETFKV